MSVIKVNKISGGGICSALCVVFLLAASYIPLKIALLFATSIVMGICILRYKTATALISYFGVSILSLFIAPKMAGYYITLFGIYPIIKLYVEKIKNIYAEYVLKIIVWNLNLFGVYIVLNVFGQHKLLDLGTVWFWLAGLVILGAYDLIFSIFINGFYKTYYKYLS